MKRRAFLAHKLCSLHFTTQHYFLFRSNINSRQTFNFTHGYAKYMCIFCRKLLIWTFIWDEHYKIHIVSIFDTQILFYFSGYQQKILDRYSRNFVLVKSLFWDIVRHDILIIHLHGFTFLTMLCLLTTTYLLTMQYTWAGPVTFAYYETKQPKIFVVFNQYWILKGKYIGHQKHLYASFWGIQFSLNYCSKELYPAIFKICKFHF